MFVLGCYSPASIRLGDDSSECRETLKRWGATNVQIAWSYELDLSLSSEEAAKRFRKLQTENDFNDNPAYVWPELGKSTVLFLRSKNGKLVEIVRIDKSESKQGDWKGGFTEVTRSGFFVKAKETTEVDQ